MEGRGKSSTIMDTTDEAIFNTPFSPDLLIIVITRAGQIATIICRGMGSDVTGTLAFDSNDNNWFFSCYSRTVMNFSCGNNGTRPGTNFNTLGSGNNDVGQDGNFCDSVVSTFSNARSSGFNPFRTQTVSAVEANQRSNMAQGQQKSLLGPFSGVHSLSNNNAIQGLNPLITEEYARRVEFGGLQRTVHQSVSVSNNVGGSSDSGATFTDSMGVERLKKQLCKNYFGSRGCTKGMNCTFMHQDFPCWLFHVKGECSEEGSSCKFSHEELSPMKRKILVGVNLQFALLLDAHIMMIVIGRLLILFEFFSEHCKV